MSLRPRSSLVCTPLVFAIATAIGCEVRVETPPDDDFGADVWGSGDGRLDDAPPLTPAHPEGELGPAYDAEGGAAANEPPYVELAPDLYPALIVVDAELIRGARASSASAGSPFSFRTQMEWLAGERDAVEFTRAWLEQWETVTTVGSAQAPVVPRPAVRRRLLVPWLGASAAAAAVSGSAGDAGAASHAAGMQPAQSEPGSSSGPDAAADAPGSPPSTPGYGEAPSTAPPSWSDVPFRLIAIVNRVDLASEPCASGGELRYVYTAIDPDSGDALEMTAILEIPYPSTRPAAAWARAWSDLAALPPGEAYAAELERLAREVRAEADPLRVRLLTSEIELAAEPSSGWEMREFHVEVRGDRLALVQAPLAHTPRADLEPARLSEHVLAHADAIRAAGVALPEDLQAGAATLPAADFRWSVLGVSESLSHAFSVQTCNGCHGGDTRALPFQHIMPIGTPGIAARVSRFLYDPDAESDELRRRARVLDALVQSACEPPPGAHLYP